MRKFSFLLVVLILFVGGMFVWWNSSTAAVNPADKTTRPFVINKGESVREIATALKNEGLISDTVAFFLLIKKNGLDGKIQAGQFYLSPSMNQQEIVQALQRGTHDIRITIPEGKRAEEIADILQNNFTSYDPSWRTALITQEGYLFPDTYSFAKDASIDDIVQTLTGTFNKKYQAINGPRKANLTEKEIITIASMVEREAKHDEDRPIVASVILNRLDAGMALDIDATVQYAIGNNTKWWPTLQDAARNIAPQSAYNSYTHAGLPPTPIANPGEKALEATVNPAQTDYLFYITDGSGINHYARTNKEHEENIQKYGL